MSRAPEPDAERQQIDWSKITMPCPKCGGTMVVRQNRTTGVRFMGCTNWPMTGCPGRGSIPAYAFAVAQGAARLPGFES